MRASQLESKLERAQNLAILEKVLISSGSQTKLIRLLFGSHQDTENAKK